MTHDLRLEAEIVAQALVAVLERGLTIRVTLGDDEDDWEECKCEQEPGCQMGRSW